MPERATVNQVTQIGVEAGGTPGTLVAATRRLQSFSIDPGPDVEVDEFRPEGYKYHTLVNPVKESVTADIEGRPTYNELAYLLSSCLTTAAVVANGAGFNWAFTPATNADDAPKTLTVERGSGVRAHRFGYGLVSELNLTFDRDAGVSLEGSMIGTRLEDNIVLSAGATELVPVPIYIGQTDIFLDPTFATIGTTKLARCKTARLSIGDRWNPVWVIDSTKPSFAAHVENAPTVRLELTVEADAAGMALLGNLRNGDTRFVRIRSQGPLIAAAVFNTFTADVAGKIAEVGDFEESDGLVTIGWTFDAVHDPTAGWARAFRIDLTNTLAAL